MLYTLKRIAKLIDCSENTARIYICRLSHIIPKKIQHRTFYVNLQKQDIEEMRELYKNALSRRGKYKRRGNLWGK